MPFDQKKFNKITSMIEEGASLRKACKDIKMSRRTFYEWLEDQKVDEETREERQNQYARACEERAHSMFEDILDIADDSQNDDSGDKKTDNENIHRSKLRVDTRKWMLSKMNPKKYGDKIQVDQNVTEQKRICDLFPEELKGMIEGGEEDE